MKLALGLVLVAACHPGTGDYPIEPGGGDDVVTPTVHDAPAPDGNDAMGARIAGRVCLLADLRATTACAASGADGLTVQLGTQTAITASDGTFAIARPASSAVTWLVSGSTLVSSIMAFGASPVIPAIDAATYRDLLISNGVILLPGQGSAVVRVTRAGVPVAGAIASAMPTPSYAPSYDGTSASTWDHDATGALGDVWLVGAAAGALAVSVTPMGGSAVTTSLPIADQAITFATVEVP